MILRHLCHLERCLGNYWGTWWMGGMSKKSRHLGSYKIWLRKSEPFFDKKQGSIPNRSQKTSQKTQRTKFNPYTTIMTPHPSKHSEKLKHFLYFSVPVNLLFFRFFEISFKFNQKFSFLKVSSYESCCQMATALSF